VMIVAPLNFFCSALHAHITAYTARIFPVQQVSLFLPLIFLGTVSG
jgi:hypothetical protein